MMLSRNRMGLKRAQIGLGATFIVFMTLYPLKAFQFVRVLPDYYRPNVQIDVTIYAFSDFGDMVYAIEDRVPAGWEVSFVDEGGNFDEKSRLVKFGVFFDNSNRIFHYRVIPSVKTKGPAIFQGLGSYGKDDGKTYSPSFIGRPNIILDPDIQTSHPGNPKVGPSYGTTE